MLRLPSAQREYDEFYSGDPAFVQPPDAPPASASAEAVKAYRDACAEHAHKIVVARETGNWSALLVEGQTPTKFTMRPLAGELYRHLTDLITTDVKPAISNHVVFRTALTRVAGLGDLQVKVGYHEDPALRMLGKIATSEIPNVLDGIDKSIVNELAVVAYEKAKSPSPK